MWYVLLVIVTIVLMIEERKRKKLRKVVERENDGREMINSSYEWNFVFKGIMDILSAFADVTMLILKV